MKPLLVVFFFFPFSCILYPAAFSQQPQINCVTVPIILDHNRMLVDAEIQRNNSSWQKVRLWVDSGNPTFFMSESLANTLGISSSLLPGTASCEVLSPSAMRIGGMNLVFDDVKSVIRAQPYWLFSTMGNDANLPSTILKHYQVVFDYPNRTLTLALPGSLEHLGVHSSATVNPETGIVQMDAIMSGDTISLALDNGASYSFVSADFLEKYSKGHPEWPRITGTAGCANMWGWWPPDEQLFSHVRIPEIHWGQINLKDIGVVGVPRRSPDEASWGEWYSQKTVHPVAGFLGANALKSYRVEIDYQNNSVYLKKDPIEENREMDVVGISIGQLPDKRYQVIGVVKKDEKSMVERVQPGDILIEIDGFNTQGATMGSVVDALRGNPGDSHSLLLERNGERFLVEAKVEHLL